MRPAKVIPADFFFKKQISSLAEASKWQDTAGQKEQAFIYQKPSSSAAASPPA